MKAIETVYRGYRFRSRLEARWAVFFDELGVEWQYEPEGFEHNGERWLPDFFLPRFSGGFYVEVKADGALPSALLRAERIASSGDLQLLYAIGAPACIGYSVLARGFGTDVAVFRDKYLVGANRGEHRLYFDYGGDEIREGRPYLDDIEFVGRACIAARQARFEHGQVGSPRHWGSAPA